VNVNGVELTRMQLRSTTANVSVEKPSEDPIGRIRQVRAITAAYKSLTPEEPLLPSPDSPLPALLALRGTQKLIDQTKISMRETKDSIVQARARLSREEAESKDAQDLRLGLEDRIEKLKVERDELVGRSIEMAAKDLMQEQAQRRTYYAKELRRLVKAFNKFINEHLAVMIAAEDLGGPVVGDTIDIDEEILKAGYTQGGKPKKPGVDNSKNDEKRAQRNRDIWASDENVNIVDETRSEKEAAEASFRSLTEELLNSSASDDPAGSYIDIRHETAAVRFLVRTRVAEFDPDDARKLRLVNFAGDSAESTAFDVDHSDL